MPSTISPTLSLFVIAIVFIVIAANAYFKFSILKQYKYLANKGIDLDPKALMREKTREAYLAQLKSPYRRELEAFGKSLGRLLRFVIIGFCTLLLVFGYIYLFRN